MDIGAVVNFNGKRNIFYFDEKVFEYPVGGMICEYARLHPADIKPILMEYQDFEVKPNRDNVLDMSMWLLQRLTDQFPPVTANMIFTDFINCFDEDMNAKKEDLAEMFKSLNEGVETDDVKKFILEGSKYSEFGADELGQMLLSAYAVYASSFVAFKYSFNMLVTGDEFDEDAVMAFWNFYGDETSFQHIDFKIMLVEGKFCSIYTIKSSMSLLLFEAAHVLDEGTIFVKCGNCGEYFVPEGRSDAIYCSYPAPEETGKTCKEVGAQNTRANKEKNDVTTKAYRKVYGRYMTHLTRHPDDTKKRDALNQLTTEVKEWRKKLHDGTATCESFLDWLNQY